MPVTLRDYQQQGVLNIRNAFARSRRVLFVLPTGGGKCLAKGTPVMLFDGRVVPVEDVCVGDLLMGPDSKPRRVLSLARGREEMFRVTPTKGNAYTVNRSHILSLKMTGGSKHSTGIADGTIIDISVDDYLRTTKTFRHCAKAWRTDVFFPRHAEHPLIDPYFLGLWLGDGSSRAPEITTGDLAVKQFCHRYARSIGLYIRSEWNSANSEILTFRGEVWDTFKGRGYRTNPLRVWLDHYKLTRNKHIPHRYKTGSREERMELLAGIIDTDGHWTGKGFDITLKSERLMDDVIFVARSLGFAAYKSPCKKTCTNNGKTGDYFRCNISGPCDLIPVKIARKKAAARLQIKDVLVTGIKVESVGVGDYYGFEIDGDRRFLLGDFTVTHNTLMFSYIADGTQRKRKRVGIFAHRRELLRQISKALDMFGVPHAILNADSRGMPRAPVIVGSIFTFINRMKFAPEFDLLIVDEAHHAAIGTTWGKVINNFPKARVLGVTATPLRLDGQGLADSFDEMVVGPSVAELTAMGWLSPAEVYAPKNALDLRGLKVRGGDYVTSEIAAVMDKPSITGNAVEHYTRMAAGRSAVAFCCSIQHAEDVAAEFRAASITSEHIDGKMEAFERDAALRRFEKGETKVLTSCDLISEGFDMPSIEVAILLRPTKSLGLYMQQVGRAIRPAPGKARTLVLDHAHNVAEHGFIDEPREWSLTAKERGKARARQDPISTCPVCYSVHRPQPICPRCGYVYQTEGRVVQQFDGQLERISGPEEIQLALRESAYAKSYAILLNVAKSRSMERAHEWAFANVAAQYARDLARQGERKVEGYMINGLSLEERDRLMQMIRGTQNQVEMVL